MGLSWSFVEPEAKFNESSLLLNTHHFDIRRHTWKWCKENSQNSETHAITKTPLGTLSVERYKKKHLAAQVCSANGLCSIFKFSEILVSTTYNHFKWSLQECKSRFQCVKYYNKPLVLQKMNSSTLTSKFWLSNSQSHKGWKLCL